MATAADLGISEQEFQDAINLERIYGLVNSLNNRCTRCGEKGISHADKDAYELLCSNCARGRSRCRRIGDSRFRTYEVDKFEEKFGRTASKGRRSSTPPRGGVKSSYVDGHRKGRNSKAKGKKKGRHYASSSEDSDDESNDNTDSTLSGSDSSTIQARQKKKPARSSKIKSKKAGKNKTLGDSWEPQGDPFSQQPQRPAGMLGIYQQAAMRPQMGQPYGVSSLMQPSPFGNPSMAGNAMAFTSSNRSMMQAPPNGMPNSMRNMSQPTQPYPTMRPQMGVSRNPFAASIGGPRTTASMGMRLQPATAGFGAARNPGSQGMVPNNPWGGNMGAGSRPVGPFIAQTGGGMWGQQQQTPQNPFHQPSQGMMQNMHPQTMRPQFGMLQQSFPQQQQTSMFGAVDSGWW